MVDDNYANCVIEGLKLLRYPKAVREPPVHTVHRGKR